MDRDPGTMQVALQILCTTAYKFSESETDSLLLCLLNIFSQVVGGKLPTGTQFRGFAQNCDFESGYLML